MCGQLAYATNESSYKFGLEQGKVEWQTCQNPDADCETASQACTDHQIFYVNGIGRVGPPPDNQTVCEDGFLSTFHK
jgi:hypothetical protein